MIHLLNLSIEQVTNAQKRLVICTQQEVIIKCVARTDPEFNPMIEREALLPPAIILFATENTLYFHI